MKENLWVNSTGDYASEQAERQAIFRKIAPPHWKDPIDAWIDEDDFGDCDEAARFFTGGSLSIRKRKDGKLRVVSGGYYRNIGS